MRRADGNAGPVTDGRLSLSQQQMWVMEQLQPGTPLYNIPTAFRLRGDLDVVLLRRALQTILDRHAILRTRFPVLDGEPVPVAEDWSGPLLPVEDFRGLPAYDGEEEASRIFREESLAPFGLEQGMPTRLRLLRLGDQDHILVLVFHHIVFDGSSRGILLEELMECYRAGLRGVPADLPRLNMQFSDYVLHERELDYSSALAFWQEKFKDLPPRLQLPTDRARPAVQTFRGAVAEFRVDDRIGRRTAELSTQEGVTRFATLLAAFQVLLARYTGQTDIAVGIPVAGRAEAEAEHLIGCFVNTLPVRVDLSGDPAFREVLREVSDSLLDAFDHMSAQFDEIVRLVQPERDLSCTPLVQVTFGMLGDDVRKVLELPGLVVTSVPPVRTTAKFDLSLDLFQEAGGLRGEVEYNTDLFDEPTIQRMIGHWLTLLEAAVTDPDLPVAELPLLMASEWDEWVDAWNRTEVEVPGPGLMHQLFEEQARRVPDAVALVYGDVRISYAELDQRANQLAHLLRERNVGPEVTVGVCMERSHTTVIALLAILKAGGAYTPLDPDYPDERLAFMLRDAGVALLLTDTATLPRVSGVELASLLLDQEQDTLAAQPCGPVEATADPDNAACMFYTSGSSGLPKCGMLTHANYVNYYRFWERTYLRDTPLRVHTQMTSFAFDIFIADTTRALFSGATLVMVPREVVMSPADLYALMLREGVRSSEFITPILAALVDYVDETGQSLDFMDLICAGSDMWYSSDYERLKRLCRSDTRIIAAYGTSETSNDNSTFEQRRGAMAEELGAIVPIGRPVANTKLYVLDPAMQPVPVGLPGELCIGGMSLGRGYHRRPGLTAERFVPNPFAAEPGSRLYRTGDLARLRADGILEILGRVDNQVKVRGFRVEPGEIETVLRAHPDVTQAVVVIRELGSGENCLVGYLALQPGAGSGEPAVAGVRGYLEAKLPAYMVPTVLMVLPEMPLSANGKVDRRALPIPAGSAGGASYRAPRTPVEEILAGLWSDILGLGQVGIHDDFFSLGGSSLLLTRLAARIRAVWAVEVPVRVLYGAPTVAELAVEVARYRDAEGTAGEPLRRAARGPGDLMELSFAQEQLWFQEQLAPGTSRYSVPTMLRLRGPFDPSAFRQALQSVVDGHEALRTVFLTVDGKPRQRVLAGVQVPLTEGDLTHVPESGRLDAAQQQMGFEERMPFNLSTGPLLRATLLRFDLDDCVLLLNMHHAITDGWSTDVFFREITQLYAQVVAGEEARPAEPGLQYPDFSAWQRGWLAGPAARTQQEFWRKYLLDAPAESVFPPDRTPAADGEARGAQVPVCVPEDLCRELELCGREAGATLFMVLLAAFQGLLSWYSGATDVVVGTPSAGRSHVELEPVVGLFANMLPLRTDLSGTPTFRQLLGRVRESALDAYAHQDLPFEKIVEAVGPLRRPDQNPIFQTALVLNDDYAASLQLPGVSVEELDVAYSSAKFDLSMLLVRRGGGLQGALSYRSDLYDADTVRRLAQDWSLLLRTVADDPDREPGSIPPPRRIPAPGPRDGGDAAGTVDAPDLAVRSALEEVLTAIWCELLDRDDVGIHDNFFLVGGSSLLVARLVLRIEELLGPKLAVRAVFEDATIAGLAAKTDTLLTPAARDRLAELCAGLGNAEEQASP